MGQATEGVGVKTGKLPEIEIADPTSALEADALITRLKRWSFRVRRRGNGGLVN